MAQICARCGATADDDSSRCARCGEELDQFKTIQPPRFQMPSAAAASPPPAARTPREAEPPAASEPAPSTPAPRPRSRPRPQPAAPRVAPPAPSPAPVPVPPPSPPPAPYPYAAPPPQGPMGDAGGPPGKLRSMLIKMLGGNTEPGQMPAASPYPPGWAPPPAAPQAPQVPVPPAYPYGQSWLPMAPGGPPAPPLPPTPSDSFGYVQPITPPSPAARTPDEADEEGMTRMMGGADLQRLKMPSRIFTLQILDKGQDWHNWTVISAAGLKVGRSEKNVQFPELSSMATRHLRIGYEGGRVKLEDLGALNGIFLRVTRPVELEDGSEFRVGDRVFRFRAAAPVEPVGPRVAEDGEEFWSGDLHALAYLDAIRPDGEVGLRFPITKRDATILGRGGRPGKPVDIALPDDEIVSGQHAQVRPQGDGFVLEDLNSRNGTFLRVRGEATIEPGEVMLVGRVLLRVVAQ